MIATMENLRAAVVMDGEERCAMLKRHSDEFLEDMELLAEAHKTNLYLKMNFIAQSAHDFDCDTRALYAIDKRVCNTIAMIQRIQYERSYPNVPRRAEWYGENEPALTEDEYKSMMTILSEYCREYKE